MSPDDRPVEKPHRKRGRPSKPMPEQIPDTPENVAWALMTSPPRQPDEWEYRRTDRSNEHDLTGEESSDTSG